MAAPIPGGLLVQSLEPLDAKYWVQNFSNISNGLVFQGLMRFVKATNQLFIKLDSGWTEIPTVDTIGNSFSIEIGQVLQGNQAVVSNSGSPTNVVLDFMLPKGDTGEAATIVISQLNISSDGNAHIYNQGTSQNANYILEIPAGPQGIQGPQFTINQSGIADDRVKYNGEAAGFTYLVDDLGASDDGSFYVSDGNGGWSSPVLFRGPKGLSVYIAYAETDYGSEASFAPNSSKKYISFLNQNIQPDIADFTEWLPITFNGAGFVSNTDLNIALSNYKLDNLNDVNTTGVVNGSRLGYNSSTQTWGPVASSGGDMLKSTYDTTNNGIVDNAEALNGQTPAYYLNRDNHSDGTTFKGFSLTEKNKLTAITGTNTGDQTTITGNASTATTLQTARTINGVSFNGSADITITSTDSTKLAKAGDIITGNIGNTSTGFFRVASGSTALRPITPLDGMIRYNTDTLRTEFYSNSAWRNMARLEGDTLTGTAGSGYIGYISQSTAPSTPTDGFRLYADASNRLAWKGINGFVRVFDGTSNTADRTYSLPDISGTIALTSDLTSKANLTGAIFTGAVSATNLSGTNTGDQDLSGKLNVDTTSTLAFGATIPVDFNTSTVQTLTLTGNTLFVTSNNKAQFKYKRIVISNFSGTDYTVTLNTSWYKNTASLLIPTGKKAMLSLDVTTGTAETDIWAGIFLAI